MRLDPVAPKDVSKDSDSLPLLSAFLLAFSLGSMQSAQKFQVSLWWQNGCSCSRPHVFTPHRLRERESKPWHSLSLSLVPSESRVCPWTDHCGGGGEKRRWEKLTVLNLWGRGVAHTQEQVVWPIPTEAPGWEIGRGDFSRENRDEVDQKRENGC